MPASVDRSVFSVLLVVLLSGCNSSAPEPNPEQLPSSATEPAPESAVEPVASNQGEWQAQEAVLAGNAFPPNVTESILLTISGTEYIVSVGGKPDKGTCELDAASSPARLTITGTEGPNAGKILLAICDFPSEKEMRVCYDMTGESFPSEFLSTADNGYFLVSYQRKE